VANSLGAVCLIEIPKISIVTPSFNQGRFIEKTILSVLEQDYPNLEYIIIDGGSTDESAEIIKKYEKQLAYWVSEQDRGQSHAINKGFERATGEIFCWLNSDDWFHPGALTAVAEAFRANPGVGAVVGAGEMVDEEGKVLSHLKPFEVTVESLYRWLNRYFWQPSCFFSREAWQQCGPLDENINFAMDLALWLRIAKKYRFLPIDTMLSTSLKHAGAKTTAFDYYGVMDAVMVIVRHGGENHVREDVSNYADHLKRMQSGFEQQIAELDSRCKLLLGQVGKTYASSEMAFSGLLSKFGLMQMICFAINVKRLFINSKNKLIFSATLKSITRQAKNALSRARSKKQSKAAIVTRNACHGGVESLIKVESDGLGIPVIVAGGLNNPEGTCAFEYAYIDNYDDLVDELSHYSIVLYHWPMDWAVMAIKNSGIASVEFVHRTDTSDCDKAIPIKVVTHSDKVAEYLRTKYGINPEIVTNVVDTDKFKPQQDNAPKYVGAITSYYNIKGINILVDAWAEIAAKFSEYTLRFYGAGDDLPQYVEQAKNLGVAVEFMSPLKNPEAHYNEFKVYVSAARMEGLPLAILEALSCNVPVLASDIPGHKIINEMAHQHGFPDVITLFRDGDRHDLADKLSMILTRGGAVTTRDVVEVLFSPKAHISGIEKVLKSSLHVGSRPSKSLIQIDDETIIFNNMIVYNSGDNEALGPDYANYQQKNIELVTYRLPIGATSILVDIYHRCIESGNILIQVNWYSMFYIVCDSDSVGRKVSAGSGKIHLYFDIPIQYQPVSVDLVTVPDPGTAILLDKIHISARK